MTTRRSASPTPAPTPRPVGRPRSSSADRAILDAALAILGEKGVNGLTMSEVVERSGVARATVYRRYPTREQLAAAALARVKGRDPFRLSGDLATDLERAVHQVTAVLREGEFRRFLPSMVGEALKGPSAAKGQIDRVAPNHARVAQEYETHAAAAGFRDDVDGSLVSDLIMGAMLFRLLSTGRPPDRSAEQQLLAILERGLRADEASEEGAA